MWKTWTKKTANNSSIIINSILGIVIIAYMIYMITIFYPLLKNDNYLEYYLFPVSAGYNGFKISFIMFLSLLVLYILNIYFIVIKKGLNFKLTCLISVIAILLTVAMSVSYSYKSTGNNYCSYTDNINDYLIMDDEDALEDYVKYFPYKTEVLKYEYFCNRSTSSELNKTDVYFNTSVYITILYNEEAYNKILNEYTKYTNKNNSLFNEVYNLEKNKDYTMYAMVNQKDGTIIYAFQTSSNDIFDKNNEKNIIDYLENNRSNPF